jgi:Ca2+-dependent lipid-binding protein
MLLFRHLKSLDKKNLSDPYARVYLMPDEKRSLKRKTKIVKNNLNPIWQETFDYALSLEDTLKKELTVNLKDERGLFEKQESKFLGEV